MKKIIFISALFAFVANGAFAQPPDPGHNASAVRNYHHYDKSAVVQENPSDDAGSAGIPWDDGPLSSRPAIRYLHDYDKNQQNGWNTAEDVLGVGENASAKNVSVVNPVGNEISITTPESLNIIRVEVYDRTAGLLWTEKTAGCNVHISADRLRTGIYFVRIYMNTGVLTKEIYKM